MAEGEGVWARARIESDVAALRAAIGDAAFEAARARGLAMTTDEAVAFALEMAGTSPDWRTGTTGTSRWFVAIMVTIVRCGGPSWDESVLPS